MKRLRPLLISLSLCLSLPSFAMDDLKLEDLGFKDSEVKVDKNLTKVLEKRNSMLKTHQYLSLGALALMTGAIATAGEHGEAPDAHAAMGIGGAALYYTAASFALLAPEIKNHKTSGNTKWHKRLAWIHVPALLLGPTLGYLANEKYKKGETPTGLMANHAAITTLGYLAFLTSAGLMTFEF